LRNELSYDKMKFNADIGSILEHRKETQKNQVALTGI
jgi:hypothetical protein